MLSLDSFIEDFLHPLQDAEMSEAEEAEEADPAKALPSDQLRQDLEAELGGMAVQELQGVNVRLLLGKLSEWRGFAFVCCCMSSFFLYCFKIGGHGWAWVVE